MHNHAKQLLQSYVGPFDNDSAYLHYDCASVPAGICWWGAVVLGDLVRVYGHLFCNRHRVYVFYDCDRLKHITWNYWLPRNRNSIPKVLVLAGHYLNSALRLSTIEHEYQPSVSLRPHWQALQVDTNDEARKATKATQVQQDCDLPHHWKAPTQRWLWASPLLHSFLFLFCARERLSVRAPCVVWRVRAPHLAVRLLVPRPVRSLRARDLLRSHYYQHGRLRRR